MKDKIGFGGGCHWCTEAVFASLDGVKQVEQGWIASEPPNEDWSEAVRIVFDAQVIPLKVLIEIHLMTHSSEVIHSMRKKYRSAIYTTTLEQERDANQILDHFRTSHGKNYITHVLSFQKFNLNKQEYLQYHAKNPDAPFCKRYIDPKLHLLRKRFSSYTK